MAISAAGYGALATIGTAFVGSVTNRGGSRADIRYGHSSDNRYALAKESELYDRARDRGLTPQEYYGSSAPGVSGPSGAASVLGNSRTQRDIQRQQSITAAGQAAADRQNRLDTTNIQARTQIETAKIQAGTQTRGQDITEGVQQRGQDITEKIGMGNLHLNTEKYLKIQIPQAAANLKKTTQEVNKIINEVATSTPKFLKMIKIMTMGSDNSYGLAIQNMLGIDISNVKQMQSLPVDTRRKLLAGLLSGSSNAAKEFAGFSGNIDQWLDTIAMGISKSIDAVSDTFKPGIEPANPTLGRRSRKNTQLQGTRFH